MLNWRDVKNPDAGGSEVHMHEIGSRWVKSGHAVTLLVSSFGRGSKEELVDGVDIRRTGNKLTVYLGIIKNLLTSRKLNDYDVIFESINTIPFFAPIFSKIPVVGQIYSIENKSVLLQEASPSMIPLASVAYLLSSAIPRVYKKCEVTTISNASKEALESEGFSSERIHVAYPGLSNSWLEIIRKQGWIERPNHSIVYLGRLKKYKGVQDLLHAIPAMRKKIPGIKLRIVGKGDYEPILRSLVNSLGIEQNVEFCGFVSERKKARILSESSLYVCTSLDEGGWTIAAVEAMSAGVPVLVTKSQIDVIGDGRTGRLLRSSDPETIAENAVDLLQDRNAWSILSKNSIDFSKRFNWDNTAAITLEALQRAVQDPARNNSGA